MSIDYDKFVEWAESRFGHVVLSGSEVKVNSIFCEDRKHHLWCSPSGGKKNNENGVYHCWKSESKGSLVGLVMLVDGCSYEEALRTLDASPSGGIADLERRVEEMFAEKTPPASDLASNSHPPLSLPSECYYFEDLPSGNGFRVRAEEYLRSRSIPSDGLMVCTSGRYKNRILIPYRNRVGALIYYNARLVGESGSSLRYLGPPKEMGVGKGDVLYCRRWPPPGSKVYITEGEFDSISLDLCGFPSVALGGKNMTDPHLDMIRGLRPVLCLDADDSGGEALPRMATKLSNAGFESIRYVRPSCEYKDWNGLLKARGTKAVEAYIKHNEKDYEFTVGGDWEGTLMSVNRMIP